MPDSFPAAGTNTNSNGPEAKEPRSATDHAEVTEEASRSRRELPSVESPPVTPALTVREVN